MFLLSVFFLLCLNSLWRRRNSKEGETNKKKIFKTNCEDLSIVFEESKELSFERVMHVFCIFLNRWKIQNRLAYLYDMNGTNSCLILFFSDQFLIQMKRSSCYPNIVYQRPISSAYRSTWCSHPLRSLTGSGCMRCCTLRSGPKWIIFLGRTLHLLWEKCTEKSILLSQCISVPIDYFMM